VVDIEQTSDGAATARKFTTETLARWSATTSPGELELLVSEIVTNAIVHGSPPICLRLTHLGDEVLAEVDDGSAGNLRRRRPEPGEENGRGLRILKMLARRSGVSHGPNGKTVWCTVPVAPMVDTGG
jgi:anti-sigma regulatory factor (Ser/Thr protein kinase)